MRHTPLLLLALTLTLAGLAACASAPEEEPFDVSTLGPPPAPTGPGAFYTFLSQQSHTTRLKAATREFATGNEGDNDATAPQADMLCSVDNTFPIEGGRISVVVCLGFEHGQTANGTWLITDAGLWRLDSTPEPTAKAADLAVGEPWISAVPKQRTLEGNVYRTITEEPAYQAWCVQDSTSQPLEDNMVCLRHDGFLLLRERVELPNGLTRIVEAVSEASPHGPKP